MRHRPSDAELVARHLDADGRLATMPVKADRRHLVLCHLADRIPPGISLDEFAVNNLLRGFSDDVATLRRFLVEAKLLDRPTPGHYRRRATLEAPPGPAPGGSDGAHTHRS